jgi:hypothetical protein
MRRLPPACRPMMSAPDTSPRHPPPSDHAPGHPRRTDISGLRFVASSSGASAIGTHARPNMQALPGAPLARLQCARSTASGHGAPQSQQRPTPRPGQRAVSPPAAECASLGLQFQISMRGSDLGRFDCVQSMRAGDGIELANMRFDAKDLQEVMALLTKLG